MKLRSFLQLVDSLELMPNIVWDNFGDALMYHHNPIIRRIRDRVIGLGYRFSTKDHFNYFSCKFNALDGIKANRVLPYLPNHGVLVDIEKRCPGQFTLKDVVGMGVDWNATSVHESCHAIAAEAVKSVDLSLPSGRTFILNANLEEAFTDAAEHLSHIYTETPAERFTALHNMYVRLSKEARCFLKDTVRSYGLEQTAVALILLGICVHSLIEEPSHKAIARLKDLSEDNPLFGAGGKVSQTRKKLYRLLMEKIDPFRIGLANFYFRTHGFRGGIYKTLNFDPSLFMCQKKDIYVPVIRTLGAVISSDDAGSVQKKPMSDAA